METLEMQVPINIWGTIREMAVLQAIELPIEKKPYVSVLTTRLKAELGHIYTTKSLGNKFIVIRIK